MDFEVLNDRLGGAIVDKRRGRQPVFIPSTNTLRPCSDESVDWDTSQDLMIEVDDLEVLKLRKSATRATSF